MNTLINTVLRGGSYGDRRGAAWGLAGVTKGLGIACLTNQNVVTRLKQGCKVRGVVCYLVPFCTLYLVPCLSLVCPLFVPCLYRPL
jgi:hypothetical protein